MLMNSTMTFVSVQSLCATFWTHTHTHTRTHACTHTHTHAQNTPHTHVCRNTHTRMHAHTHTRTHIKHLHHTHMYVETHTHTHTPSAASTKMYRGKRKRASQILCQCIWSSSSKLCRWRQQNHSMSVFGHLHQIKPCRWRQHKHSMWLWVYLVIFIKLSCGGEYDTNTPYESSPESERRLQWFLTCSHLILRTSCPCYLLQSSSRLITVSNALSIAINPPILSALLLISQPADSLHQTLPCWFLCLFCFRSINME